MNKQEEKDLPLSKQRQIALNSSAQLPLIKKKNNLHLFQSMKNLSWQKLFKLSDTQDNDGKYLTESNRSQMDWTRPRALHHRA